MTDECLYDMIHVCFLIKGERERRGKKRGEGERGEWLAGERKKLPAPGQVPFLRNPSLFYLPAATNGCWMRVHPGGC